jgi:ubiquitin carboxyl-terminal hydrolase 36/42
MSCLAESNTYESVLDLTVEITGSASLEGALHTFTSPEWLDGDNKYKCDK